ncbi:MAG: universal stress protein [Planctomycetota bacterium]|nr:universal stress protein [Planctomycetota bacterium]
MAPKSVERILVPTDLTTAVDALIDYSIGLADQLGAELLFFAVLDSPTALRLIERHHDGMKRSDSAGFRSKLADDAKVLLQELVDRAAEHRVRASGHAVVSEKVGQEVLREARERNADLIVLAAEDRSMLWRFLFGDSLEEISHLAPCPVLTVPTRTPR